MILNKNIDKFVVCTCGSTEHLIRLQLFQWMNKYGETTDVDVSFEIHLVSNYSFLSRLWIGLKYIFGFKQKNGHFEDVLLNRDKAKEIILFLQDYVNSGPVDHE